MMKKICFCIFLSSIIFACTSGKEYGQPLESHAQLERELAKYTVSSNRLKLFANLSKYGVNNNDGAVKTKSSEEVFYCLDELLDFTNVKSKAFGENLFTQVPFKQNADHIYASIHKEPDISSKDVSIVKKYLIRAENENGSSMMYVVTMIPEAENELSDKCDFLEKANFSGLCIYSGLDGSKATILRYVNGCICKTEPVDPEDNNRDDIEYLSLVEYLQTKSDDGIPEIIGGPISKSICLAFRNSWISPSFCIGANGASGGGGYNNSNSNSAGCQLNRPKLDHAPGDDFLYPKQDECILEVLSNMQDTVSFTCNGKSFTKGTLLYIIPIFKVPFLPEFSKWVGDFWEYNDDEVEFKVDRDIFTVAYYDISTPCVDTTKKVGNPLVNMELAPTDSGNILNALYSTATDKRGNTRHSGQHNGIDFAAKVGTPVFSMYDGTITKVVSCQPDGNPRFFSSDIPDHDYAGNRIEVKSSINGQTYILGYCHLQAGNAVAVNPRTLQPFRVNDFVFRGEILGYTGRTGNAYNVNNPHLHLSMKETNGKRVDPAPFINGKVHFDVKNKEAFIDNIICD